MGKLKINVVIAGRTYPLQVSNQEEEEGLRKAVKSINKLVSIYEQNYAVRDKQDVLAMCALQFASRKEISDIEEKSTSIEVAKVINKLTKRVSSHLGKVL